MNGTLMISMNLENLPYQAELETPTINAAVFQLQQYWRERYHSPSYYSDRRKRLRRRSSDDGRPALTANPGMEPVPPHPYLFKPESLRDVKGDDMEPQTDKESES